jgi:C4-dicarboxylate-binding protein DctP
MQLLRTSFGAAMLSLAMVLLHSTSTHAADPILIKYAHVVPAGTPKGAAADRFAEIVNERLAGKVKVEVYPNAQLFDEDAAFQALLLGDIQITAPVAAKCSPFSKQLQLFDLPFLFEDRAAVDRFEKSPAGQELLNSMSSKGLKGLAYGSEGMFQLLTKTPVRVPADAKDMKFRIMASDVLAAKFQAVGAHAQKMAFSEVYSALQTGVVDGVEMNWASYWGKKFFETAKYFTLTNHMPGVYLLVTNDKWWAGLPDDIRTELEAIIAEVQDEQHRLSEQGEEEARQKIAAAGVNEFLQPTPEEMASWRAAMAPVYKQYEAEIGKDLIEAALASNSM